tara:strand:- start:71 stop:526 length:456 start_codon:yes stop_codon:yes gene_type:complete
MEFILFIDKIEKEIISVVEKAGYSTEENTPLCLLGKDYVGFFKKKQKKIVICTKNIKEREGYKNIKRNKDVFERTAIHIKKAIRHEAVHVAQACNNGKLLDIDKKLSINPAKIDALKESTKISGEQEKEIQAYILEDKPKLVRHQLKRYCL